MASTSSVFGGELTIRTFARVPGQRGPTEEDKIMHSQLETPTAWPDGRRHPELDGFPPRQTIRSRSAATTRPCCAATGTASGRRVRGRAPSRAPWGDTVRHVRRPVRHRLARQRCRPAGLKLASDRGSCHRTSLLAVISNRRCRAPRRTAAAQQGSRPHSGGGGGCRVGARLRCVMNQLAAAQTQDTSQSTPTVRVAEWRGVREHRREGLPWRTTLEHRVTTRPPRGRAERTWRTSSSRIRATTPGLCVSYTRP